MEAQCFPGRSEALTREGIAATSEGEVGTYNIISSVVITTITMIITTITIINSHRKLEILSREEKSFATASEKEGGDERGAGKRNLWKIFLLIVKYY